MTAKKRLSRISEQPPLLTPAQFLAMGAQVDGTIVDVLADAAAGVIWRLRFNAASASANKWEVVGGRPLFSEATAVSATVSAIAYGDLAGSPAIVVPLAGDYDYSQGAMLAATASGGSIWQSPVFSGAAAGDTDACVQGSQSTAGAGNWYSVTRDSRRPIAAGFNARLQYKAAGTGGAGNAQQRWLKLMPVRVAGP